MSGGGGGSPGGWFSSVLYRRELKGIKKAYDALLKSNNTENKRPFQVDYEVEYLGDGDHCHLGEKYIISHTTNGMYFDKPLTLQQAKKIAKEENGKVIKVSRTYL